MSMFQFDPRQYAPGYKNDGFVHIPGGVTESFYGLLERQIEEYLLTHRLHDYLVGDKQQAVYQLPEGERFRRELLDHVGVVCGVDPAALVMSERHIKVYDDGAAPNPLAHKDRFASQISMGISVHVPEGSTLVLYPYDHLEVNSFNSSTELRKSRMPDNPPERDLRSARRVEIADRPRDVVIFRGNSIWHLRARPAGTTMVYLKFNVWNCDPLGEDANTPDVRDRTCHLLELDDEALMRSIPLIGRRVDYIHRRYDRNWQEVIGVVLWGQTHSTIDERELRTLRSIDGRSTLRTLIHAAGAGPDRSSIVDQVRRLAARGIIDLLPIGAAATPEPGRTFADLAAPVA
jgi:hypothetical protein